ncbi:MAG: hypothetical protein QOG58_374, partial [Caballeronia sp.]|nr:hypothetical protein [Caballeronia sp.]
AVSEGECRILFVTPERLIKEHFVAVLGAGERQRWR